MMAKARRKKNKTETMNATRRLETKLINQDERMKEQQGKESREVDDGDEEVGVKWLCHYSSVQQILLVGEGDFSFSLALANAFSSAANIVATSLDSYDDLLLKYGQAKSNLEKLLEMGATILHVVDCTRMKLHTDLNMRRFDRIVYNFPHAGFRGKEDQLHVINLHRSLVKGFFQNACHMLRPYGEVHISHKSGGPFRKWNLEELASMFSLALVECIDFRKEDYPGYCNKRGEGKKCDCSFPLGHCSTYMFRLGDVKKNSSRLNLHFVNRVPVAAPSLLSSHLEGYFTRIDRPPIFYARATPILNLEWRREQDFSFYDEAIARSTIHMHERQSIDAPILPSMLAQYERDGQRYSTEHIHEYQSIYASRVSPMLAQYERDDRRYSIEHVHDAPRVLPMLAQYERDDQRDSPVHMHERQSINAPRVRPMLARYERESIDVPIVPPMLAQYERDDQRYSTVHMHERQSIDAPRVPSMLDPHERDDQRYQWHSCRLHMYEPEEIVTDATHARRVRELCQSSILRNASLRRIIHWRYLHEDNICYDNYITRIG